MNKDERMGISHLIEKGAKSNDKFLKPDFSKKTGRELMASYLQTKFKQILEYDSKTNNPIFTSIKNDFIKNFSNRLIESPQKRIMIGITGESASGKSTICETIKEIINQYNMPVTIMSTDNYFNDISDLINKYGTFDALRDAGYDVDSPNSFQLDILKKDLLSLSAGEDIYMPQYLVNGTGISVPNAIHVPSNKIIIVEGIASMYNDIQDIFDIRIYVETTIDIRHERFLTRACTERNQDFENAQKHWNYILSAGEKYVKPYKACADIVLNGDSNLVYFSQMIEYIHKFTNNFES